MSGISAIIVVVAVVYGLPRWRANRQEGRLIRARETFQRRREWLEAKFLTLASQSGRPRGLSWAHCEFDDQVTFARDRNSGDISAFVAVTIKFEAVPGGGMEEVEAVANHKAATAVFTFGGDDDWFTQGRTVFNLNPVETIERFQNELESVDGI